jgi:hypothetical protein
MRNGNRNCFYSKSNQMDRLGSFVSIWKKQKRDSMLPIKELLDYMPCSHVDRLAARKKR